MTSRDRQPTTCASRAKPAASADAGAVASAAVAPGAALAGVLERLASLARAPFDADAMAPVDPERVLARLYEVRDALDAEVVPSKAPSEGTLARARARWRAEGRIDALNPREIRALCWDDEIGVAPEFVTALSGHADLGRKRRWLEGLVTSYLAGWRPARRPAEIERTLQTAVQAFTGRSVLLERCRPVATHVFSTAAPRWFAERAIRANIHLRQQLEEWQIGPAGPLGAATANAATDVWLEMFLPHQDRITGDAAVQAVRYALEYLLDQPLVERGAVVRMLAALIDWPEVARNDDVKARIKAFCLSDARFGDPRLPKNHPHWADVPADARKRVVAWLSTRDLLFFFNFVIKHDPHGRKEFWLRYIDQVDDSNVALIDTDEWRLKRSANRGEELSYSQVTGANRCSAFLMRFRGAEDIIFVEFAEPGNALYLHDATKFEKLNGGIRNPEFRFRPHLKSVQSGKQRFSHVAGWQEEVKAQLSRLGIRPTNGIMR